jgi:hypothetical protein
MALSEKSWERSIEQRMTRAKQHTSYPSIPLFPMDFFESPFTIWDFFPPSWTCPHDVQRVGNLGDGGKWVCGMSIYESLPGSDTAALPSLDPQDGIVVYSFGISDNSYFEADLLERVPSARIWGYDPSVRGWGGQINWAHAARTSFKKIGLSGEDKHAGTPPFWTLSALMKENGHNYIDILKVDIEGYEFEALDAFMQSIEDTRTASGDGVLPVGQLSIEIHLGNGTHQLTEHDEKEMNFTRFRVWWERLEEMGMRPTWTEMNLLAVTLHHNRRSPDCAEYVFVNAKDERNVLWR